ncbi:peptide/nickel transport system ATP-binding protein [Hoeflea halophila]|uniref:Peptide/nickel transport system ATP-binding protein n=1 Tax=Hoeflea halophila TaxID=714899 RepID=A0A286IAC8_9HYPH|nr:ATP-binding cassette domain-containing protein [Hoeflea halophila]SOE16586.1 peptide/nickel transport system ATP-binding protein [Hoeflea halophila]
MTAPILELAAVSKIFGTGADAVRAAQSISFAVNKGECLAIVGESGSGKSTVANMILGIYPPSGGEIRLNGTTLPASRKLEHRRAIQLVQQNPLSSLNPRRSIGASLRLALDVHGIGARKERADLVGGLLEEVGLPADFARRSPAALSGGQCQRVAIARALACQSEIVVLDEPTSALDVLVQARVLKLLNQLRETRNLTFVFITHDLSVVRNIASRIAVFEKGRMVELGQTEDLFANPAHSYTRRLISAVPVVTREEDALRSSLAAGLEETTK